MKCGRFQTTLIRHACGILPRRRRRDEADLSRCPKYADLWSIGGEKWDLPAQEVPPDMVESILRRTTGRACLTITHHLESWARGEGDALDRRLLANHLEFCPGCRSRSSEFMKGRTAPPTWAEATTRSPSRRRAGENSGRDGAGQTWRNRLLGALVKPGFSLEAAYVGTLLLLLFVGNPAAVLKETSLRAHKTVTNRASRTFDSLREPLESGLQQVTGVLRTQSANLANSGGTLLETASGIPSDARQWLDGLEGADRGKVVLDRSVAVLREFWRGLLH